MPYRNDIVGLTSTGGAVRKGSQLAAARADAAVNPQGGRHSDVQTQFDGYFRSINNRNRLLGAQGNKVNTDIRGIGNGMSTRTGMSPSMSALQRSAAPGLSFGQAWNMSGPDPMQKELQLEQLRSARMGNDAASMALYEAANADSPFHVQRRGDISRGEAVRNARATGEANSAKHFAEFDMRNDQRFEERADARERGYFDPAVAKAEIDARGIVQKAEADRQRERSAAFRALSDLVRQQSQTQPEIQDGFVPGTGFFGYGAKPQMKPNPQWEALERAVGDARNVVGGLGNGEGGGAGGKQLSMQEVEEFAAEQGVSMDEAMRMAEQHGYAVR